MLAASVAKTAWKKVLHMNLKHQPLALGLSLALSAATLACSKSDSPAAADGSAPGTAVPMPVAPGTVSATPGACAKNDITIAFSPMYSAFDGMHTFQVPAIVDGIAATAITWSASDPTMVGLQPDATTGGVMITTLKAGVVDIIATAGSICGSSKLTISQAEVDDWVAGDMRYNNGVVLERPMRRDGGAGGGGDGGRPDGGGGNGNGGLGTVDGGTLNRVACTNCHGPTANGPFKTVSHTPQQIGGFSDDQLKQIFNGMWPTGSGTPFDTSIVGMNEWSRFHKWEMTEDEAAGIIIYLRGLTPTKQTGSRNFGGRGPGGNNGDGGGRGRPNDAGAVD
jgi:hypothetical protein